MMHDKIKMIESIAFCKTTLEVTGYGVLDSISLNELEENLGKRFAYNLIAGAKARGMILLPKSNDLYQINDNQIVFVCLARKEMNKYPVLVQKIINNKPAVIIIIASSFNDEVKAHVWSFDGTTWTVEVGHSV